MESNQNPTLKTKPYLVSSIESDEFSLLRWALGHSSTVGLDAEWKPFRTPNSPSFPPVSILQLAFRVPGQLAGDTESRNDSLVFLVDLQSIHLPSIWELLRDMFVSPDILKLGFRFKQDLIYLSSTFCSQGCDPGFEKVEPYLDITSIYYHLQNKHVGKKLPKETKSLAAICEEVLRVSLSKELQCSDWSRRPLTEEQISYAAADAYCLLEIFSIFQRKLLSQGKSSQDITKLHFSNASLGLKEILEKSDVSGNILRLKVCEASEMVKSTICKSHPRVHSVVKPPSCSSHRNALPFDDTTLKIIRKYGERILLKESDRKPRASKQKARRKASLVSNSKKECSKDCSDWQGPPPWDSSFGGDGCPKFLCDVMVEGLAKHLRCVGIDAAIPSSKRPEPRLLIDKAHKEGRVLLTRDAKLLKHEYLIRNQVYRVKSLLKNDQLLEICDIQAVYQTSCTRIPWLKVRAGPFIKQPRDICKKCMALKLAKFCFYPFLFASDGPPDEWAHLIWGPRDLYGGTNPDGELWYSSKMAAWHTWRCVEGLAILMSGVIETFQLKINEDQLMSRCTKCNGMFIQKPLTTEEAIAAAKGFQVIPGCLYDRNFEFWQCTDCNQLYWEGTQYHNAVQKFIDVCKLNE